MIAFCHQVFTVTVTLLELIDFFDYFDVLFDESLEGFALLVLAMGEETDKL